MPALCKIPSSVIVIFNVFLITLPSVNAKGLHCDSFTLQSSGHSLLQRISYEHLQVAQLKAANVAESEPELVRESGPPDGSSNAIELKPVPEWESSNDASTNGTSTNGTLTNVTSPEPESDTDTDPDPPNGSLPNGSLPCPNETGQIPLEAKQKFQESCHMHLNESLGVNASLGEMEKDAGMNGPEFFAVMESMCQEGTTEHDACFGLVARYFEGCDVNEANVTHWKESMGQFCDMLRLLSSAASSSVPGEQSLTTGNDQM